MIGSSCARVCVRDHSVAVDKDIVVREPIVLKSTRAWNQIVADATYRCLPFSYNIRYK